MDKQIYTRAVSTVLRNTDASQRRWLKREKLPGGIPFRPAGAVVAGPQCVTVTVQVRHEDLDRVMSLGEQFAYTANSQFARVYRRQAVVCVEFTLPASQWREVPLGNLPHRREAATIGQVSTGPVLRIDWRSPHKALFGTSQSGKTVCLADTIISLAKTHQPDDYRMLILNPKNDPKLQPFERLAHLAAPLAVDHESCANLLRFALGEMTLRLGDADRQRQRLVVFVDEMADLVMNHEAAGQMITTLSQKAGGLNINLVVASQGANPRVFDPKNGSMAKANFPSRLVFQLPREQAWMATGVKGQETDKLGGNGDGLAVSNGQVSRFRAALPAPSDYESLPRSERAPAMPAPEQLAGDAAAEGLEVYVDMLAYAYSVPNGRTKKLPASATSIRQEFGIGTTRAREVRNMARYFRRRVRHWRLATRGTV